MDDSLLVTVVHRIAHLREQLETIADGQIFLEDNNITSLPMYRRAKRGIGYLAQEASVFRTLTVEENLMAVLQMTKLSKHDQKQKVE